MHPATTRTRGSAPGRGNGESTILRFGEHELDAALFELRHGGVSFRDFTVRDAEPIDVLHREDVHFRGFDQLLFDLIEITDADEHRMLR